MVQAMLKRQPWLTVELLRMPPDSTETLSPMLLLTRIPTLTPSTAGQLRVWLLQTHVRPSDRESPSSRCRRRAARSRLQYPGGPLHETYIKAVRALRRQAIDSVRGDPDTDPRRIAAVLCHRLAASAEAGGAGEGTPDPARREPAGDAQDTAEGTAQSTAERFRRHARELGHTPPPDAG